MKKMNIIMAGIVSTSVLAPLSVMAQDITVKSGDTLSELAVKHNTSISSIKTMNGLKTNVIRIGQRLKVGASQISSSSGTVINCTYLNVRSSASISSKIKATVKGGTKVEILGQSGSWFQIKANGHTGYVSKKYVKASGVSAPVSAPKAGSTTALHTVQRGDTLSEIAVKYKMTVNTLRSINALKSNTIRIGQKLKVSGSASSNNVVPVSNSQTSVYTVRSGDTLSEIAVKHRTTVSAIKSLNGLKNNTIRIGQNLKVSGVPSVVNSKQIFQRPTDTTRITSHFGPRSIGYHYGIDYAMPGNQRILAAADGIVSQSYNHHLWGEVVFIKHTINGKNYETIYAHMRTNSRAVKAGTRVKAGQFIGWMGSTGNSTGQHLHFEVHPGGYKKQAVTSVNPFPLIK